MAKKSAQPVMTAQDKKWMAQDDMRIIQRAHEIMQDPKRMKAAQKEANQQVEALQKVAKAKPKGK